MDAERWRIVKEAFGRASEAAGVQRPAILAAYDADVRAEVEKMLAVSADENSVLDNPLGDVHLLDDAPPARIGDYRVVREIGRGGMGVVYEAVRETDDFTQKAAVKVIKRGMNNDVILKRFRAEQQILASLEHENIGRFLDGGRTDDGLPYYAMEFVDGVAIDTYCAADPDPKSIAALFREVCAAVSYAHGQLVVHRDLKPSNILVTSAGKPKLLDFGIAKVLDVESGDGTATRTPCGPIGSSKTVVSQSRWTPSR